MYWLHLTWVWYIRYTGACRDGLPLMWGCNLWLIGNILLCLPSHNLSSTSLLLSHTVSDSAFVTSLLPLAEHSQFSFLMEQWHSCNPSSAIDPHQVLECWIFHHFRIEHTVCEHLMTLRSHFITRLNRHCTRKLYSLLQRYTFLYCACLYALLATMHESQDKD